jgi:2-polyprenyl-3-methyl-5-hydroxy-6-metoxy-1,4-benzoquinol methylase
MKLKLTALLLLLSVALPGVLAAQTRKPGLRWDEIYTSADAKIPVNPSALVLETAANLPPGEALDIGMGNGRNALYLARKGWKVTGIDSSAAAVKLAQDQASKLNAQLDARVARFEDFAAARGKYDVILCMYVPELVTRHARRIVESLKPGGLLIVEGPHIESNSAASQGGFSTNELLRTFSGLRIVRYEDRPMQSEWGSSDRGPVVRLVARKR